MRHFTFFLAITFLFSCKSETTVLPMKTYYSSNKSFSIDVPINYQLYQETLPNYMDFRAKDGIITIERKFLMENAAFKKYVKESVTENHQKLHYKEIIASDTFFHYKMHKGLFTAHEFYMRKIIEGYSYIVTYFDISASDTIAKNIYNSIIAY